MTEGPLSNLGGAPYYDEPTTFCNFFGSIVPFEFNGWKPESLSWKKGCYIHAGLSNSVLHFTGPDVIPFFESICTNSFAKFPVGSIKHAIMCVETGNVAAHGVLQRNSEDQLAWMAGGGWPEYMLGKTDFDVKVEFVPRFIFQVAGPTSLEVLERATGESLGDIAFLRFRTATIEGRQVEVARLGMAGTLAYEVRGDFSEGPVVYDAIYRAGQGSGIERLGIRTYTVNHVEGGFPQISWTFHSAWAEDPDATNPMVGAPLNVSGSVDPAEMTARYRNPLELKWDKAVKFDHDFCGREALEQIAANPRRTTAMLRWNPEDVIDIYASLLQPGEEYRTIDLPTSPSLLDGVLAHADHILKDGRRIGVSSGTTYSYHFREVISMACIDIAEAEIGNEVIVQWGHHGGRIKDVRATVERYPYLSEGRNDQVVTAKVPA
jgi:glycine cleavage system aminomethyltransferase T